MDFTEEALARLFELLEHYPQTPRGERRALLAWYVEIRRADWPDLRTPDATFSLDGPSTPPAGPSDDETGTPG